MHKHHIYHMFCLFCNLLLLCVWGCAVISLTWMCEQHKHSILRLENQGCLDRINPSQTKRWAHTHTRTLHFNERKRRAWPLSTQTYTYTHYYGRLRVPWQRASRVHPLPPPKSNPLPESGGSEDAHARIFRRWSMREPSRTSESAISVISPHALGMLKKTRQIASLHALCQGKRETEQKRERLSQSKCQSEWMWCESKNNSPQISISTVG